MAKYDPVRLEGLVQDFNSNLEKKYSLNGSFFLPSIGYTVFSIRDMGDVFSLDASVVSQQHTEGIDAGQDERLSFLFSKIPLRLIGADEGESVLFGAPPMVFSVARHDSCAGTRIPSGEISMRDLQTGNLIFFAMLPNQTISLEMVSHTQNGSSTVQFLAEEESSVEEDSGQHSCESGSWVGRATVEYEIRCAGNERKCVMSKWQVGMSYGCQSVGECD
jgi:hypothetical protein